MSDTKNFQTNTSIHNHETKNVLVISDLAENVNEQDLNIFLEQFKDSILVTQYNRSRSEFLGGKANSATIIFKEFKEAERAKYELNMRKLKGKTVRITWHERDSTLRYSNQENVYIKNIPLNVTPRQFYEYFYTFGEIVSAKLVEDEEGNHLGYGYVHYSTVEAKNKCIKEANEKEVWPGDKLVVENFQKKQERGGVSTMNPNKSIFMKNFPADYDEKKIKELIGNVKVSWMKIMIDPKDRKYAIIILENEDDVSKIKALNKKIVEGDNELFVDNLMSKHDRKRYLNSKIYDTNIQLTRKFKNCNLHVRNLPLEMGENELKELFSKYGSIKSVKIPLTTTVTKINGKFVETTTSPGFGYVCFNDPDAAKNALDDLNGKPIEGCKRNILINYFMSKNERSQVLSTSAGPFSKKGMNWEQLNMNQPFMGGDILYNRNMKNYPGGNVGGRGFHQQNQKNNIGVIRENQVQNQDVNVIVEKKTVDEPDYELLKNMEDDSSKKDYLGEFIFRKIESHNLTEANGLTMDHIGKITGMILGIEDVNEIIDICKNNDHLTSRIIEALSLLQSSG